MHVFPFSTCESNSNNGIVAQPFSAAVNLVTCFALLGLMSTAKTRPVRLVLGVYALFQAWHAFSHAKHVTGNIQTNVVHVLAYMMSLATLYAILALSQGDLSHLIACLIVGTIIVDLYVWVYVKGVWTVFSGLVVLATLVFGNYDRLPSFFKACIPYLVVGLMILFALVANEKYNCERMMRHKVLPYHAAIEIVGFVLFVALAVLFLRWERRQ